MQIYANESFLSQEARILEKIQNGEKRLHMCVNVLVSYIQV